MVDGGGGMLAVLRAWWRGGWTRVALVGAAAAVLVLIALPLDGPVGRWAHTIDLPNDFERELLAAQQWGAPFSLALVTIFTGLVAPGRVRRCLDLWMASGLVWLAVKALKLTVGRPRPRYDDPYTFVGPFAKYDLGSQAGPRYGWEFWEGDSSALLSMPSSHTAAAAALSVFLVAVLPRSWPLAWGMVLVVGAARVVFTAHYPTDVIVGAAIGLVIAKPAVDGYWGVRFLDWIWVRIIDREAPPAYPALRAREELALRSLGAGSAPDGAPDGRKV